MKKYIKDIILLMILVLSLFLASKCEAQAVKSESIEFTQKKDGTFVLSHYDFYNGMSLNPQISIAPNDKVKDYLWNKTIQRIQSGEVTNIQEKINGDWIIAGYTLKGKQIAGHPSDYDYWIIRIQPYYIEPLYFAKASLFPNPFYEETNLFVNKELCTGKYWITIYDFLGKTIRLIPIKEKQTKIRKQDLTPGVYYYTVNSASNVGPKGKFIVL